MPAVFEPDDSRARKTAGVKPAAREGFFLRFFAGVRSLFSAPCPLPSSLSEPDSSPPRT
jgi:hypothetical protein